MKVPLPLLMTDQDAQQEKRLLAQYGDENAFLGLLDDSSASVAA